MSIILSWICSQIISLVVRKAIIPTVILSFCQLYDTDLFLFYLKSSLKCLFVSFFSDLHTQAANTSSCQLLPSDCCWYTSAAVDTQLIHINFHWLVCPGCYCCGVVCAFISREETLINSLHISLKHSCICCDIPADAVEWMGKESTSLHLWSKLLQWQREDNRGQVIRNG